MVRQENIKKGALWLDDLQLTSTKSDNPLATCRIDLDATIASLVAQSPIA